MDWGDIKFGPHADPVILARLYTRRFRIRPASAVDLTLETEAAHEAMRTLVAEPGDATRARKGRIVGSALLLPDVIPCLLRALSELLKETYDANKLAKLLAGADHDRRVTLREAIQSAVQGKPIQLSLIQELAESCGLPVDELVSHAAYQVNFSGRQTAARSIDIAASIRQAERVGLQGALSTFPLTLRDADTDEALAKLTSDIVDLATDLEIWPPAMSRAAAERRDEGRIFVRLQSLKMPEQRIKRTAHHLRKFRDDLRATGRVIRFARYIRVRSLDAHDKHAPCTHYRVLRIWVGQPSDTQPQTVDLWDDYCLRYTQREYLILGYEAHPMAAVRRGVACVRRDIAWCGHWEGRWLDWWPVPGLQRIREALGA